MNRLARWNQTWKPCHSTSTIVLVLLMNLYKCMKRNEFYVNVPNHVGEIILGRIFFWTTNLGHCELNLWGVLTSNMKMITLEYLEREECKSLGLVIPPNHIQFLSAHFTIFQVRTLKLELNKHNDHKYNVFKLDLTSKGLTWEPSIGCKLYQEITIHFHM
jgi:hypothetical protein